MQRTTTNTTTTTAKTIQAIIDQFFEWDVIESIEEDLYECIYLAQTQSEGNDTSLEYDVKVFSTMRSTINFLTDLEKFACDPHNKINDTSSSNLSVKQNIVLPANSSNELQKIINAYYKKQTARQANFFLWDIYVSAMGHDKITKWTPHKHSNIAFLVLHLNEMIMDLEQFKSDGACLS